MPLAGATGPVTLLDSVVQHAAESLSGVVIHQLARAGAPIVWGGSPAIFDMRTGTTPMGAVESIMMDCAYAQVGKYSGLPTHAYAGLSDAKVVDTQAGLESGIGVLLAALARVNMISGAGMLDFEKCFSLEKLVIDHELIGMARRFLRGIEPREELASDVIRQVGIGGNFLSGKHTSRWFKQEHHIPSILIDRDFRKKWEKKGAKDTAWRANRHVEELIDHYEPVELEGNLKERLSSITTRMAQSCGMNKLPPLPD
jgi:trimethylamine--corrinoid protein Co-methyltransferase